MPHISINGIEKKDFDRLCPQIQQTVSDIVNVGIEKVVLEYAPAQLNVCGSAPEGLATVHIWWRRRPAQMQHDVAYAIGNMLKEQAGKKQVKVKYVNLDPDDLYDI